MQTTGLEQKIKDLEFKINTTPRWLGKFIYQRMLHKTKAIHKDKLTAHKQLKLCYEHRQENNHSHYANHNCDHCKALDKISTLSSRGLNRN
jgi:hypothetical protein